MDDHDGVVTHLEQDILECEVRWDLGSVATNKASGGDGIPAKLYEILKDDAVKMLHFIYQKIWKTWQWSEDCNGQISLQFQRKAMPKNIQTTILISHTSKVMLKIIQARLQQYVNIHTKGVQRQQRRNEQMGRSSLVEY